MTLLPEEWNDCWNLLILRYAIGNYLYYWIWRAACGVILNTVDPVEFILSFTPMGGDAWFLV